MLTCGHNKMRILNFGHASQRSDGFVEGDICANVYGSFTLVPINPIVYRTFKVDPMGFGKTKVDPLKIGELLLILRVSGELRSIP